MYVRDSVHGARRGGKTRVGTLIKDHYVSVEVIANFFVGSSFSDVNGVQTEGSERLDAEAL